MDYRERVKKWEQSLNRGPAGVIHVAEFARKPCPKPKDGDTWGDWKYDAKTLVLVYRANTNEYPIDLERCVTASSVLDWIGQLNEKTWASTECMGHLARALDDLLDLRSNIVHLPLEKTFDVREYLSK